MKIKHLSLFLLAGLSLQTIACGQMATNSQANENQTNKTVAERKTADQSKEIKLPSGIKNTDYERNPDESLLVLTVNSGGQVFYQDKQIDDAALKNILAKYNEKHKNDPSTSDTKYPSLYEDKYKSFYLKADGGTLFSQVIKVLKAVQASSNTAYVAKFIVKPLKEIGKAIETSNGRSVIKIDLGVQKKIDENALLRPNPLLLVTRLDASGKATLNADPPMAMSELNTRLTKLFKEREQSGVFREGTNEVEKKVFIITAPEIKYGEAIKFIDELNEIGAQPVEISELSNEKALQPQVVPGQPKAIPNGGEGSGIGRGSGIGTGNTSPPAPKKKNN